MRFIPKFNSLLKRNVWIVTLVFFIPILIILLGEILKISILIGGYIGSYDISMYEQEIIENLKSVNVFIKDWFLVYAISIIYTVFSWLSMNLFEKTFIYEKENDNYYRKIIETATPSELSYIDDYGIEIKKDIVATILMLILKNKIEIVNNKIVLKKEYLIHDGLLKSEIVVLKNIANGISPFKEENYFKRVLLEDLDDSGLIEEKTTISPRFFIEMLICFIYGVLLIILSKFININVFSVFVLCLGIMAVVVPCFLLLNFFSMIPFIEEYKKLTKKGKKIRFQLNGLRLFLKDYSDMKNKELNEFGLWDEYMVYSVILNDNKKVQKEVLKMIKEQFK